jgi:Flp pilus assembly protein TadG
MLLRRFLRNRDAGVAPMLALAKLPLFGFVGAAIDFSRAASVRTAMQGALDATALILSKDAQTLTTADLVQRASDDFKAQFNRPDANDVALNTQFTQPQQGNFSLKITATASVNTVFSKLLGQSSINLSASSSVLWGIRKLNLALVLDNTGSMSQNNKMTNLKIAAHNLLTTLQNAAKTPGDIQVAIVPFATDVNVDTGNVSAYWIDWTDWEANNGT